MISNDMLNALALEADYACFNRRRSLRYANEGTPSFTREAGWIQVKDPSAPTDTYVNRLIVVRPGCEADLQRAVQSFTDQGLSVSVDVLPHTLSSALASWLIEAGFRPIRELMFLKKDPGAAGPVTPAITLKRIGAGEGRVFLDAVLASLGQEVSPSLLASKGRFYEAHPFLCYLAYAGEELAGMATTYIAGDRAWLANAFTFEAFRGRGVQSALIQRRLQDAQALGVRSLFTDVEFLSPSFRNLERHGFAFHYSATTWERPVLMDAVPQNCQSTT